MPIGDVVADIQARIKNAIPFIGAGIVGAIVLFIVEFSAGWVVSASTHVDELSEARVNTAASICATDARASWTSQDKSLEALDGWDNEKRDKLAKRFAPTLEKVEQDRVVERCDELINAPV